MFCKKCGSEIKDGVKFCGKCGEPTPNFHPTDAQPVPPEPPVSPVSPEPNVTQEVHATAPQEPPVQNPFNPQNFMPNGNGAAAVAPKKQSKAPFIILGIVGGVVVILLILFVIGMFSSDDFSIDTVKDSTMSYYDEDTNFGDAFDSTFYNGTWTEGNIEDQKYVAYDGYIDDENGDQVEAFILFLQNEESGEVYSIDLEDEYGNTAELTSPKDVKGFFDYVFHGKDFEWYWD